jgi:hypothetical protein
MLVLAAVLLFIVPLVIGMIYRATPGGKAAAAAIARGEAAKTERHVEAEANQQNEEVERQRQRLAKIKANAISAADLTRIYQRNEVNADNLFKGREIVVRGTVGRIAKEILGRPYIILSEQPSGLGSVQCVFKSEETRLAALLPGNIVYVRGTVVGKTMNVVLASCTLLTQDGSW